MEPSRARCEACSTELLPDSLYCHACGLKVPGTSGAVGLPARPGERKRITVLFVDAFGSMSFGERLDPEQWYDVVERFFAIVSNGVRRFGGTIDRLTGGGIKVLFGAPLAQENHAHQACHAALYLASALAEFRKDFQRAAGIEFSARMGLASGEVVFGRVGAGPATDFTSQGYTAALAARMEQLAEPGRIYLAQSTAALISGFFELRDVGTMSVRGSSTAVQVYELLRASEHRSRLDVARDRGLSRFVGRDREMAELEGLLDAARTTGPRVVGIVGEPGVGKSRLGDEFVERLLARGLGVHHVRCVEHGRWLAFHATLPFLRSQLGIDPREGDATNRDRVVARIVALDPALEDTVPVLLSILGLSGVPLAPATVATGAPARDVTRVMRALVEARDVQPPSLFVLDDQHWMDAGSEAVFANLVAEPPRGAHLVLVTYRPGHKQRWMADPAFSEIMLRPLDRRTTLELARSLLGDDPSVADLPAQIDERACGNPLFVEEIVISLAEKAVLDGHRGAYRLRATACEIIVPDRLQAVLAARIDQLGDDEKSVLQAAAVIGREFAVPLLTTITGHQPSRLAAILGDLEAADLVFSLGWGDEVVYAFRHPLVQETLYRSLLAQPRAAIHRAVAGALERELEGKDGPPVPEHMALLAFHHGAAGDDLDAARWHARVAGESAEDDPKRALEHWQRVRACTARHLGSDAGRRLRLAACEGLLGLGFHQVMTLEEANELLFEGRRLAAEVGAARTTALLTGAQAVLRGARGDLHGAVAHCRQALSLAERNADVEVILFAGARLALSRRMAGDLEEAVALSDRLLGTYGTRPIRAATPSWSALHRLELVRVATNLDLGVLPAAAHDLERITSSLRGERSARILAFTLSMTANLIRLSGEAAPDLVARVEEAHSIAQRLGLAGLLARTHASLATSRLCQQRWDDALEHASAAVTSLRGLSVAFSVDVNAALLRAHALLGLGRVAEARTAAADGLSYALGRGSRLGEIDALLGLGRVLLHTGDKPDALQARRMLAHGLRLARQVKARSREPLFWVLLASYARRYGSASRVRAEQKRALRLLFSMQALGHVRRLANDLARQDPDETPEQHLAIC